MRLENMLVLPSLEKPGCIQHLFIGKTWEDDLLMAVTRVMRVD
jgi:hypothetical protein